MENAAKALLIAGGMVFAILVISVFALAYRNMVTLKQSEAEKELQEEIDKFNKPYLAFNKKAMYGTDVISILNLANNNNRIYDVTLGEEFYVDVFFKLTRDKVQNRVYTYVLDQNTAIYSSTYSAADAGYGPENEIFDININYCLSANLEQIEYFLRTAEQNEEIKTILEQSGPIINKYQIKYSGIADFKRKAFKCSKVVSDSAGRVSALYFEQIEVSVYGG